MAAMSKAPRYTGHPLSWERTDMGRPLMKLALILLALLLLGLVIAYVMAALPTGAEEPTWGQMGGLDGYVGIIFFSLTFVLSFLFPTNSILITLFMLPVLGLILLVRRGQESGEAYGPAKQEKTLEHATSLGFFGK